MTGSGVPTATSAGAPRIRRIAGVVMMPPPMPNAPESTPDTNPIPRVMSQLAHTAAAPPGSSL